MDARDDGIDLVAETKSGDCVAIQCKCYADHHKVSRDDIKDFIAAANKEIFPLRWFVATSEYTDTAKKIINRENIRVIDFTDHAIDFFGARKIIVGPAGELSVDARRASRFPCNKKPSTRSCTVSTNRARTAAG